MPQPIRPLSIASTDGSMLRAWFVYNSGSSGPGTLMAQYKGPADSAFNTAFSLNDSTGAAISVADQGWGGICRAFNSFYPYNMTILVNGDSAVSDWVSTEDPPHTWEKLN